MHPDHMAAKKAALAKILHAARGGVAGQLKARYAPPAHAAPAAPPPPAQLAGMTTGQHEDGALGLEHLDEDSLKKLLG